MCLSLALLVLVFEGGMMRLQIRIAHLNLALGIKGTLCKCTARYWISPQYGFWFHLVQFRVLAHRR